MIDSANYITIAPITDKSFHGDKQLIQLEGESADDKCLSLDELSEDHSLKHPMYIAADNHLLRSVIFKYLHIIVSCL